MFTLPIHDLYFSNTGDSKKIAFSGDVYDGYFSDIQFIWPLSFSLKLESGEKSILVTIESLHARIRKDEKTHDIEIRKKKKVFRKETSKNTPFSIHTEDYTIDIAPFIHEVILLSLG